MKIENAIILAAGRGSRMKELTDDKPKCMQLIDNTSVIQRTINVFKYKNIKRIIVVTGYKSEILRKHLSTLYNDIIFVENDNWQNTNSIYSMYSVIKKIPAKYLTSTIVIDSDIYINNVDCIQNNIEYSGYSAVKNINVKEWQLLTCKQHRIIDTRKSGYFENGLPIIDISYWTKKDFAFIAKKICNAIDNKEFQRYWDEIPLFDYLMQIYLKRYDINENDAMEFDTKEDLEEVRKIVCSVD